MLFIGNMFSIPVLDLRFIQDIVTISAVLPLTGSGLNGLVGPVVPVTIPLVPALGLSQDPATILLLLVVAGQNNFPSTN